MNLNFKFRYTPFKWALTGGSFNYQSSCKRL